MALDDKIPESLEKEFNNILGIENKSSGKKKVDMAYVDEEADPYLRENPTNELEDDNKEVVNEDEELVDEETGEEIKGTSDEEADEVATDESEDEEVIIPDNLTIAGRSAGLSDKKIVELFENEPEVLEALANTRENLLASQRPIERFEIKETKTEEPEPEKIGYVSMDDNDLTDMDENSRRVFKSIVNGQNTLIDKLNATNNELFGLRQTTKQREIKEANEFTRQIDGHFDKADDPLFGKTSSLTQQQVGARKEAYAIAVALSNANGQTLLTNLDKARKAYQGMYGDPEKVAENNLRTKLNKQKTKFSPRPGGQKKTKKYKNDDERVMAAMEDAARDLGIDLN